MPIRFYRQVSTSPHIRPIYERVLQKSGVLDHPNPVVYDIAGGAGVLHDIAGANAKNWKYWLVDENPEVLREARSRGIRTTILADAGKPPLKRNSVDYAFLLFPKSTTTEEGVTVQRTIPLLRKGGRLTFLSPGPKSFKPPKKDFTGRLRLVRTGHLTPTPEQLDVLRGYEDRPITDWSPGLRISVYEKV